MYLLHIIALQRPLKIKMGGGGFRKNFLTSILYPHLPHVSSPSVLFVCIITTTLLPLYHPHSFKLNRFA
jgi:hypothetical protein